MQQYDKVSTKVVANLKIYEKNDTVVPPYNADPQFAIVDTRSFFEGTHVQSETDYAVMALQKELETSEDTLPVVRAATESTVPDRASDNPIDKDMLYDCSMTSCKPLPSAKCSSCKMMPSEGSYYDRASPPQMCPSLWTVDKSADYNAELQLNI